MWSWVTLHGSIQPTEEFKIKTWIKDFHHFQGSKVCGFFSLLFLLPHLENVMTQISENFKCPNNYFEFFTQAICECQKLAFTKFLNLMVWSVQTLNQWALHPWIRGTRGRHGRKAAPRHRWSWYSRTKKIRRAGMGQRPEALDQREEWLVWEEERSAEPWTGCKQRMTDKWPCAWGSPEQESH